MAERCSLHLGLLRMGVFHSWPHISELFGQFGLGRELQVMQCDGGGVARCLGVDGRWLWCGGAEPLQQHSGSFIHPCSVEADKGIRNRGDVGFIVKK